MPSTGEWRCVSTTDGGRSATMTGMTEMHKLCADNWGTHLKVLLKVQWIFGILVKVYLSPWSFVTPITCAFRCPRLSGRIRTI